MAQLYLGLSGYDYKDWKGEGLFYPSDLPGSKFLDYYASRFNSLEFHGAFKSMLSETSVQNWLAKTPEGFRVAPKMNQVVTHFKRLKPEGLEPLGVFLERLGPGMSRVGPVYFQLPPNLKRDDDLLGSFLEALPVGFSWAFELPNESWRDSAVEALLRSHRAAWVATETDEAAAQFRETASFVYARLRKLDYSDEELQVWAARIQSWLAEGKDCFVYCRHKDTVAPWRWADRILELV